LATRKTRSASPLGRSLKIEERINRLRELRHGPPDSRAESTIRKALTDASNLIIAEAANVVGALQLSSLIPELLAAFDRLFVDPTKTDPKCWGKMAIVKALVQLDYSEAPPFLRGSKHIQMEPVYGGQEDAAPQLRANCCLALVQCSDLTRFEVFRHLVDAMSDPADPVRIEAVRAIHQMAGDEAVLLLRLKARIGDPRPLVIGHVFDALLNLEADRAVPFVAEYLKSADDALRDEAALALGSSRLNVGIDALIETWKQCRAGPFADVLLRAISSSRLEEALEFLLNLIKTGTDRQASAAVEALELHENSPEIHERVMEAKRSRLS
jgi:HEAT repeat protein